MSSLKPYNGIQVVSPDPCGLGAAAVNSNFKALSTTVSATAPTASDDSTRGIAVGSRWYNTATTEESICIDATPGAAVWVVVTSGALAEYLPLAGGTMAGDVDMGGHDISNVHALIAAAVGIGNTSPGALLDIGSAGTTLGTFRLQGSTSGYVQVQPSAAAGSWTLILPPGPGSAGQVLTTDGGGGASWTTAVGTVTSVAVGSADGSIIVNSGSPITSAGTIDLTAVTPTLSAVLTAGHDAGASAISNVSTLGLSGVTLAGTGGITYTFTLPSTGGTSGDVLSTNGSGGTSWVAPNPGTVTSVGISSTDGSITVNSGSPVTTSGTIDLTAVTPPLASVLAAGASAGGAGITNIATLGLAGVTLAGAGSGTYTFTLPSTGGTSGYVLSTDGTGATVWVAPGSGTVSSVAISSTDGSITVNSGSPITTSGTIDLTAVTPSLSAVLTAGSSAGGSAISNIASLGLSGVTLAGASGSAYTFTMPASGGTSGYVLSTDGTGVTSWVPQSAGSGTVISVAISSTDGSITVNSGSPVTTSGTIDLTAVNYWTVSGGNVYNNTGSNVGIGTISPSYALDVAGTFRASSGAVFGGPVSLPGYAVASLPGGAAAGATAYASNGRKAGEGSGAGTGIPVWCDGTSWRTYYDNSIAAA